ETLNASRMRCNLLRCEGADRWKQISVSTGSQIANRDLDRVFRCLMAVLLRESRGSQRATSGVVSRRIILPFLAKLAKNGGSRLIAIVNIVISQWHARRIRILAVDFVHDLFDVTIFGGFYEQVVSAVNRVT